MSLGLSLTHYTTTNVAYSNMRVGQSIFKCLYIIRGLQRTGPGRPARRKEALGPSRARPLGSLTGQQARPGRARLKKFLRPMSQPTSPNKTSLPSPSLPLTPLLRFPPSLSPLPFQRSCDCWWNTPHPHFPMVIFSISPPFPTVM